MTEKAYGTRSNRTENINSEIAVYRLMASADAFFSKKCYSEAYNGYDSILDADFSCLKAYFRREITSRYLMMETSSAYLGCGGFFTKMEEIGKRISDTDDEKLSTAVCGDMLDFIYARAEYKKKYAFTHKSRKSAEAYMTDTLQLMGYTADIAENLFEKMNGKPDRQRAFMIYDGCALVSKLKDILIISGAGYAESSEDKEQQDKNDVRIKQIRLSQDDELHMETIAANMQRLKKNILDAADPKLYLELSAAEEKSEKAVDKYEEDDEKKRAEYDLWRSRSEKEYLAADKRIVLFGILEKTAPVMSAVMLVTFAAELIAFSESIGPLIAAAVLFAAAGGVFGILKKSAVKKKGSYSKVIENGRISIRAAENDFAE